VFDATARAGYGILKKVVVIGDRAICICQSIASGG